MKTQIMNFSLGSNLSRISLVSLICLCMLTVGSGNVWGTTQAVPLGTYYKLSSTTIPHNDAYILKFTGNYILCNSDAGSNYITQNSYGSDPNSITITNDNKQLVWNVVNYSSGSFTLRGPNGEAYSNANKTASVVDNGSTWTISNNYLVTGSYYMKWVSASGFRCYNTTNNRTTLNAVYKKAVAAASSNTTYGTVSISGDVVTATPTSGYRVSTSTPYTISPSNKATVSQSGNVFTLSSFSDTVRITINFEAAAPASPEKTVYLKPNGIWNKDGARFAIYYWKSSDGEDNGWLDMSTYCGPNFTVTIPEGYDKFQFCRMNGATATNNWDNKWNRTPDLDKPTTNDVYTIEYIDGDAYHNSTGSWGTYTCPDPTTIYLNPNSIWDADGARYAAYYWEGDDSHWVDFEAACGAVTAEIPSGYTNIILCRMNGATATNNWSNCWNQTTDQVTTGHNNYVFTISSINGCTGGKSCGAWTVYSVPTYTISYAKGSTTYTGGATISGSKSNETKTCDVDFTLPSSAVFSATGYTQTGWSTSDDGTQDYALGGSYTTNAAQTFYPAWTVKTTTVSFDQNSGTGGQTTSKTATYGSAMPTPITCPTREGYDFGGYYDGTGGTGTKYYNEDGTSARNWDKEDASYTLHAKWTIKSYTINWYVGGSAEGNKLTTGSQTTNVNHGGKVTTLPTSSQTSIDCDDKTFVGWTNTTSYTHGTSLLFTDVAGSPTITEATNFYAVFADEEGSGTTTILNEPFTGFSGSATPTSPGSSATTLDGSSIGYTCTPRGSGAGNTNIQTSGGPDAGNNLLIRKKNGAFTINSIPANSQTSATLTYKWRGSGTLVLSGSSNISLGSISTETDGSSNNTCTVTITINSGTTYSLTWTNTHNDNNLRFDSPTITCSGVSYDNYITQCCALKPVTNLAVSGTTANSVTLSWTAPSPTTGIDYLELRNASTDVKIGSNIAVGTTSASVSGLTECVTYSYKVVSVGATCETSSEVIEAQPFSGAKTVTFNYNGGSGSPASFTTSCSGNTVTLPTPDTRAGYTFDGWWSAQNGGTKRGDAGDTYTVTGTTTLWGHWSQTNYTVTMAQDPAAGATLTGGTTTAHYGGTINISTDVPDGYRFTGWTASPSVTFASSSSTSTSFTMPNSDVTVTAHFVQVHTLTFDVPTGGGSAVTPPATADHGGTVTLPNVTGIAAEYSCETFLGWTTTAPNAEGGTKWSSTPTIKAAGATSDVINSNTTFYAVYSRSGGGASGTVELTQSDITAWYTAANAAGTTAYTTQNTYTAGGYTWTAKCQQSQYSSIGRLNLRVRTNNNGVSWIQIPTLPGNITTIVCDISKGNNNYSSLSGYNITFQSGTTSGESVIATSNTDDVTTRTIDLSGESYNTGYLTATYDGTINIHSITVNYGPAPVISHNVACPDCEISQFTLSYNANTSYFPGSTTTCTGVTDYIWAEHDDIYTICSTEPTLAGYKFTGWATNANGSGTVYEAGQEISCVPETPLTLYAQYERVYTIHFNDQGTLTDRTQASSGAAVTVPAHTTPCVMLGATWEFAGWSKTGGSLSDAATATIDIAANATEYTPAAIDEGQTFYAVYKKTLSGGGAFSVGKSGVYKFYYHSGSSDYWAAGKQSTYGIYSTTTASDAHSFRFTYYPTGTYAGKYTIQNDAGEYIGYSGSSTSLAYNASAADNHYYWTITASGGGFIVQNVQTTGRYLASNRGNFNGKTSSEVLSFVAADVVSYYTIMTCASSFSLTFENGGGTINWEVGHAEGTYQDVADGTVFTVFPTATMDGWTFIGWTAGQGYSDMSKYSEGRDATTGSGVIVPEDADIYSTGGNSYTIHSNITMYPVFTRFEDNEPIDLTNGGEYYMYYLAPGTNDGYGAEQRVYAAAYDGSKRYNSSALCSAATTFTFTKLGNGNWTIYDNTTNMYLCGIEEDNDLQQQASATGAEWTLTINGNQFDAYHVGTSYGQLIAQGSGTSATFMNYRRTNLTDNPALYHRVYLGSCTNRVFSSNPSTTPEIDLKGTVVITASQNGAVRNTNVLTVSGHNLTPNTGEITITSNNSDVYFSTSENSSFAMAAANQPKPSVTVTADASGIVTPTSIYVHYKPSSNADAWTDATITASYTGAEDAEVTAELRTVKENFVIAAKIANSWYALPANMGAEGVFEPVLIDVDESAKIAYGPATVGYKMWPVQTVNGGTDEYASNGDKVRFAGNSDAGLWASNSDNNIRNWSAITAIGSTAETPASYEWIIETEDRNAYTLKSMYSTNYLDLYRPTSGGHAGKLVWASNSTYETNEIHFFPLTERATINIIPREWKANGLVFSVPADNLITAASYKIGTGSETSTTYTRHSTGGYGLYEVALPDLTSQYGKLLTLKLTISGTPTYATATIPIIVNANASTKDSEPFATLDLDAKNYDVVVLSGKTLTTNASASEACKFQNLYLYPGATLVNTTNGNLSVSYLEMRGGIKGIDAKSSLEQDVPHLMLGKKMSSTAGANLDMYVNTAHSYALSVPFDVTLSNVNFANSLNTTTSAPINGTLDGQFMIMEYDGEQRASTGKGWKHITSTERTLHAGEGYVLQGKRPKGQPFAVIRFPFTGVNDWADNTNGEVTKSEIPIYAHNGGATTPDNDKGWNLIANPYMATISYNGQEEGYAADFTVGYLEKTDTDPWDGKYEWKSTTNAYVTIPNDSYTAFPQYRANSAQAVYEPFKNFFIQTNTGGSVTFAKSLRAAMPSYMKANEVTTPIYADINIAHGNAQAEAGITIDPKATTGYKFGEDQNIFENRNDLNYLKMYTVVDGHYLVGNTITPAEAEQLIPLEFFAPDVDREYVFSLSSTTDEEKLEYVMLYDALGSATNLLQYPYSVVLTESGIIENRFSIGLKAKSNDQTPTDIRDVDDGIEQPLKFIWQDKMYILRGGVIYDATGKRIKTINK